MKPPAGCVTCQEWPLRAAASSLNDEQHLEEIERRKEGLYLGA